MTYSTRSEFMEGLRAAISSYGIPDARDILLDFEQHFTDGAAAGESEEDVCRKLGDVEEIAKQYVSDDAFAKAAYSEKPADAQPARAETAQAETTAQPEAAQTETAAPEAAQPEASGFDTAQATQSQPQPQPQPQQSGGQMPYANLQPAYQAPQQQPFTANGGAIAAILCVDIFVFTWAIPTLFSLIMALIGVTFAFAVVGLVCFLGGMVGSFLDISGLLVTGFAPVSLLFLGIMMIGFAGMLVIASIASVKGFIGVIKAIINWHSRTFAGYDVFRKETK